MDSWHNRRQIIKSLKDSFIISEAELVHIKRVHSVSSILHYTSHTSSYGEMQLQVTATSYRKERGNIVKEQISTVFLTIDVSQIIIPVTKENVVLLMLDESSLIREAAEDFYKKAS